MTVQRDHAQAKDPAAAGTSGPELDRLVTGRADSLFAADVAAGRDAIAAALGGRRVLVAGGGGSIGAATVALVLDYAPAAVHVIDHSENYLAELVRDLRGRPEGLDCADFQALPIDYGSPVMERLLRESRPYDVVLNFAALKHVRSEKDIYSLLQMLDTNIVRHIRFKTWLAAHGHGAVYFAVSTDKAANPVSLMGASKRLMEDLIFNIATGQCHTCTSARFANVAFSNGSLLQGFVHRLAKHQPLAAPRETRRYFISHREAAELCILAAFRTPHRHIAVPRANPGFQLEQLEQIARHLLRHHGLVPVPYADEASARRDVDTLALKGQWPLLLTPPDTGGEKPYEEFVGHGERLVEYGLSSVAAIPHVPSGAIEQGLFERLDRLVNDPRYSVAKQDVIGALADALANFRHAASDRNLDQRL